MYSQWVSTTWMWGDNKEPRLLPSKVFYCCWWFYHCIFEKPGKTPLIFLFVRFLFFVLLPLWFFTLVTVSSNIQRTLRCPVSASSNRKVWNGKAIWKRWAGWGSSKPPFFTFFKWKVKIQTFYHEKFPIFLKITCLFHFLKTILRSHYKSQKRNMCWPNRVLCLQPPENSWEIMF